jgi:hypothetical protein
MSRSATGPSSDRDRKARKQLPDKSKCREWIATLPQPAPSGCSRADHRKRAVDESRSGQEGHLSIFAEARDAKEELTVSFEARSELQSCGPDAAAAWLSTEVPVLTDT